MTGSFWNANEHASINRAKKEYKTSIKRAFYLHSTQKSSDLQVLFKKGCSEKKIRDTDHYFFFPFFVKTFFRTAPLLAKNNFKSI